LAGLIEAGFARLRSVAAVVADGDAATQVHLDDVAINNRQHLGLHQSIIVLGKRDCPGIGGGHLGLASEVDYDLEEDHEGGQEDEEGPD